MIIAVDFDGTLCRHEYPSIGAGNQMLIEKLIDIRKNGAKLILWTCRSGETLQDAIVWCAERGLEFDSVNKDLPEIVESDFGRSKSGKVFANYYLDDRNISALEIISQFGEG